MNIELVKEARDNFAKATADLEQARALLREKELDAAIARREGKEQIAAVFDAEHTRLTTELWFPVYEKRKQAVLALCDALDIEPRILRVAL